MNISVRVESPPAAEQLLRVSESRSSTETADRGCDSDSRPRGMLTPLSPLAPSSPTLLWQFNQEGKDLTALEKFKREFPVGAKMACTPVSDYFTDVRHHYPPLEWKAELRKYGRPSAMTIESTRPRPRTSRAVPMRMRYAESMPKYLD